VRAAVFRAPGDVRIEPVPEPPPPGPGELLIKVSKAALCGTDSAEWDHGPLLARPPVILGHEFTNLCASYQTLGLHRDGGLAEYVLSPASICRAVPDELDDVGAAMAQPLAVALHAARRGRVGAGRSCVVIGAGGIGAFIVAAAAALGADPLVAVDIADGRLATAGELGATYLVNAERGDPVQAVLAAVGPDGAHVVIEASGAPASPAAALEMVRRGGDVVIVGLQAQPFVINLFDVATREVDLHGTLAHVCGEDLSAAVAVLAETRLAATVLGDVIPLGDLVDGGLRPLAERKAHGKIVVDVQGSA
jgi:threonine dehydrogenase-like Zn-dependent dehydrogenase